MAGKASPKSKVNINEEPFRQLFEKHPIPMLIFDMKTLAILDVNHMAMEKYGYTQDEFLSLTLKDICPEDDLPRLIKSMDQSRAIFHRSGEWRHHLKNGQTVDVEITTHILDFKGHQAGLLVAQDVTIRKRTADVLQESEARFRHMADTAPVLIWMSGTDVLCNYFNKPWLDFTGRTMDQEMGTGWREGIHPDDYQHCLDNYLAAFNAQHEFKMEYRLRRADGEYRWLVNHGMPRFSSDGKFVGFIGSCIDITERKQMERDLYERREYLQAVLDSSNDAVLVYDANTGRLVDVNRRMCEMYGYTREEALETSISEISQGNSPYSQVEALMWLKKGRELGPQTFEWWARRKNGQLFWAEVSVNFTAFGTNEYFVVTVHDITIRKRADAILQARLRLSQFADTHTLDELTQNTLDEAEALTNSQVSFFHFLNADQVTLELQTWSTNTIQNMCSAEGKGNHYSVDQAGVWADCIRMRAPLIYNNYDSLQHRKGLPQGHASVTRILTVPVMRDEIIVAIFGVGNKPWDYDDHDAETVSQLASSTWDIVLRKRMEDALKKNQSMLNEMGRMAAVGAWKIDLKTMEQVWTDEIYRIHEVDISFKPTIDKEFEFYPPVSRPVIERAMQRVIKYGEPFDYELEFVTAKGKHKWVHNVGEADLANGNIFGTFQDITERKKAEYELYRAQNSLETTNRELQIALAREQQLSHTDALTGVNNRRHLFKHIEHELEVARRYQQPLSVMLFDIDYFKRVNDKFGHLVGDQILEFVTQVACAELRAADVIGRYGGEEFVIALPVTNSRQAYPLAERIRESVAAIYIPTPKGDATVTLSIGITEIRLSSADESVETLISRADAAMYAAKQAGRNCVVIQE